MEKATRVLTPEEKAQLDIDWVGRDGSKRKLEVRVFMALDCAETTISDARLPF